MQGAENSCYFQFFQRFSSLQLQNQLIIHVDAGNGKLALLSILLSCLLTIPFIQLHIAHITCTCRERKTRVIFGTFSNHPHYSSQLHIIHVHAGSGKLALLSIRSATLFITTQELHKIHTGNGKLPVTFRILSNSFHYNHRTIHNPCPCRERNSRYFQYFQLFPSSCSLQFQD